MVEIDVIIPTTGKRISQLKECLNSLAKQTIPINIMLVVSRKQSKTCLADVIKSYPVTILYEPYTQFKGSRRAVACNIGIEESYHEFVAFIDDDVSVPSSWAESALKYFKDPVVGGVTSGCMPYQSTFHKVQTVGSDSHGKTFKTVTEIMSIPGYNSIYRRRAIDTVVKFNEKIGGCEDWELNRRIRNKGYILLGIPETPVEHRHNYTFYGFLRQMFGYGWSRARLLKTTRIFTPIHAAPTIGLTALLAALFVNFNVFVLCLGGYALSLVLLSLYTKPTSFMGFLQTITTFMAMHTAWAVGYVKGLID